MLSPPRTPPPANQEQSVFSDDTSDAFSTSTHSRALSPLTDEEIRAIRNFIHRHATGHRARQRRRNSIGRRSSDQNCSRASSISTSYEEHAKILESYLDEESGFNGLGDSEDDGDAESHAPMSGSEVGAKSTRSMSARSSFGNFGPLDASDCDGDAHTIGGQDEVETPVDQCNRGTFGYYDMPMMVNRRYRRGSRGIFAYEYTPSDSETEALVGSRRWRDRASGDFGDAPDIPDAFNGQNKENDRYVDSSSSCSGVPPYCPMSRDVRTCSSLYYRSSSDFTPHDDDDFAELRTSREPLVPRMLNHSDSESDRPLSSSSASMSLATSTSSGVPISPGIGLAILPPEQFAYFDTFAHSPPRNSATDDSCTDDSPKTLSCASPERRTRKLGSNEALSTQLSAPFDRLQSSLAKVEAEPPNRPLSSKRGSPSTLKPALQIKAYPASAVAASLPSPADSVSTYPPVSRIPVRVGGKKNTLDGQVASHSADEAPMHRDENAVPSFMHLTPDAPTPKQKRGRLRSLFSRSNLRNVSGRKVSGGN